MEIKADTVPPRRWGAIFSEMPKNRGFPAVVSTTRTKSGLMTRSHGVSDPHSALVPPSRGCAVVNRVRPEKVYKSSPPR
jgi:hypothetical protein